MIGRFFESTAENRSLSDPSDPESGLCGSVPEDAMHLFRSPEPGKSDLPWTGLVFGLAVSAIWYVCTDQVRTVKTDKKIMSMLKLYPVFVISGDGSTDVGQ